MIHRVGFYSRSRPPKAWRGIVMAYGWMDDVMEVERGEGVDDDELDDVARSERCHQICHGRDH
jgi:hypothetical protein